MTQEEKTIFIEEAQKVVNNFFDTPNEPMYFTVRSEYSNQFTLLQRLYGRLAGRILVIDENNIIREQEV